MRKFKSICFVTLMLLCGAATSARATYEAGERAYADGDFEKAMNEYITDSRPEALLRIGSIYYDGKGVKKDLREAAKWTQKAADKGFAKAKTCLGVMYLKGEGVTQNNIEAFNWISSAASDGFPTAEYYLGGLYYEGKGTRRSSISAVKWFRKASEDGVDQAKEALHSFEQHLVWKKENGEFLAVLALFDESGTQYPNPSHIQTESDGRVTLDINNYLTVYPEQSVEGLVTYRNCTVDANSNCSELVDIAVFRPDWTLAYEFKGIKLDENREEPNHDGVFLSDIGMTLKAEVADPPGLYHVLVDIYEQTQLPKVELHQYFWIQKSKK